MQVVPGDGFDLGTEFSGGSTHWTTANGGLETVLIDLELKTRVELVVNLVQGVQRIQPVVEKLDRVCLLYTSPSPRDS